MPFYGNIVPELDDFHCNGSGWHHIVGLRGTSPASCGVGSKVVSQASVQFADAAGRDYHIGTVSSAVSAGDPSSEPSSDIDRDARPRGAAPDAGADEAA